MNIEKDFLLKAASILLDYQLQSCMINEEIKRENQKKNQISKEIWFEDWKDCLYFYTIQ